MSDICCRDPSNPVLNLDGGGNSSVIHVMDDYEKLRNLPTIGGEEIKGDMTEKVRAIAGKSGQDSSGDDPDDPATGDDGIVIGDEDVIGEDTIDSWFD